MDEAGLPATLFAIEHLEPRIDAWLWLEYRHAAQLVERLVFTGVRDPEQRARLEELAPARAERAAEAFPSERVLALDPEAPRALAPEDFEAFGVVVVGGILGEEALTGKTRRLLTRPQRLEARSLGRLQLPIDVAVLVANLVRMGMGLDEVELTREVEVDLGPGRSVVLPYAYPIVEGKVLLTPGLVEYLRQRGA